MRVFLTLLILAVATPGLSACGIVYKLPTRQGNVIEQKQLDQLKTGMTRDQVKFLLGTPIAASPFRADRWDYLGYYKTPRGKVSSRVVSLYFENEALARMEGLAVASTGGDLETPDVKTVIEQEKKDENTKSRDESEQDTGVIITPQQ